MDAIFKKLVNAKKARELIDKPYFHPMHKGKPTKKYLKCLNAIEGAKGISEFDLINGKYDNLH